MPLSATSGAISNDCTLRPAVAAWSTVGVDPFTTSLVGAHTGWVLFGMRSHETPRSTERMMKYSLLVGGLNEKASR